MYEGLNRKYFAIQDLAVTIFSELKSSIQGATCMKVVSQDVWGNAIEFNYELVQSLWAFRLNPQGTLSCIPPHHADIRRKMSMNRKDSNNRNAKSSSVQETSKLHPGQLTVYSTQQLSWKVKTDPRTQINFRPLFTSSS